MEDNSIPNLTLFIIHIVSAASGLIITASCLFLRKWHPPLAYTAAFNISFWIGVQAIITHCGSAISVRLPDSSSDMQHNKGLVRFLVWTQFAMPLWFVFLNVAIATDLMLTQLIRMNVSRLQFIHKWYLPLASGVAFVLALPLLIYRSAYEPSSNVFSVQFPSALSVTLYYILAFDLWIALAIIYCFVTISVVVTKIVVKLRRRQKAWNHRHSLVGPDKPPSVKHHQEDTVSLPVNNLRAPPLVAAQSQPILASERICLDKLRTFTNQKDVNKKSVIFANNSSRPNEIEVAQPTYTSGATITTFNPPSVKKISWYRLRLNSLSSWSQSIRNSGNNRQTLVTSNSTPNSSPFRIPALALVRLLLYPLIPILSFTLMCVVRWVWFRSNMPSRWEILNVVSGYLRAMEGFLCLFVFLLNPALNRSFREIRKRNTPTF